MNLLKPKTCKDDIVAGVITLFQTVISAGDVRFILNVFCYCKHGSVLCSSLSVQPLLL